LSNDTVQKNNPNVFLGSLKEITKHRNI
jgi:hypothetical protein